MADRTLKFGTLGAAKITPPALIKPARKDPNVEVVAVAARDPARARAFARKHRLPRVHRAYADVIDDPELDAIYNPLPISHHREWTIRALRAGKHVLCEKAIANNADEAQEMADVARETGLVLMEAFHYRYHPVFLRAKAIVESGALGKLMRLDAEFTTPIRDPHDIRMIYEKGGGVTMDIGCYPIHWVRHLTGEEPEVVSAQAVTGPPKVDLTLTAELRFPSGTVARVHGSMADDVGFAAELVAEGATGRLVVTNPLAPQHGHRIVVTVGSERRKERLDRRSTYAYQLDAFVDAVWNGTPLPTDGQDGVRNMKVIDAAYVAAGLPPRGT
jgi:predicted dehydrogenase